MRKKRTNTSSFTEAIHQRQMCREEGTPYRTTRAEKWNPWKFKSLTFLALGAAIRRAGCVRGVVGHVPLSSSPAAAYSSRRRRRATGTAPERRRDAAHAGALLHRRRRRSRREAHAEQPHPAAGASGAGARVVAVVAAVRAPPRHRRRSAPARGGRARASGQVRVGFVRATSSERTKWDAECSGFCSPTLCFSEK